MTNIRKINFERAVLLRQQGFSYKNIAQQLGCSEAWCAKELKGVEKGEFLDERGIQIKQDLKEETLKILEAAMTQIRGL